ncbi:hypothetical protein GGI21_002693, partial [Coemansia aciculifera]
MILRSLADGWLHQPIANEPSGKQVAYVIVFWTAMAIYLIYVVPTFALYLYYALHRRDHALLQRSPYLMTLQTIFGLMYTVNTFLQGALKHYPCFVQIWLLYMGYVVWSVTAIVSMVRYYVLARSHTKMGAKLRQIPVTPENLEGHLAALLAACGTESWLGETEQVHSGGTFRPRATSRDSQFPLLRIDGNIRPDKDERSSIPLRLAQRDLVMASAAQPFVVNAFPSPPPNARLTMDENSRRQYAQPATNRQYSPSNSLSNSPEAELSRHRSSWSSVKVTRTAIWRRRLSSNRFISYVIVGTVLAMFVFLLLMNIFSPHLSLHPTYYNCYSGWEYTTLAVLAGAFNSILCPSFVILTWTYKDGYGIRRSLSIVSVTGLVLWIAALVWRFSVHIYKVRASPSLFYVVEILLVYSFTVVSPVYVAWQNAGKQKTHRAARRGWSWSAGITEVQYDLSKHSFLAAMQDAEEHKSIEEFAGQCFCAELVSFLDIYLALKMSIYKDIRQHGPCQELVSSANSNTTTHASAQFTSGQATLAASVSENLASLSPSIAATMAHAFPDSTISKNTLIPERLRCVLQTIVRTFLLPESPLAINVPHTTVCSFRDYLLSGPATFGMIEKAKEEAVDLLYSN